MALMLDEIINYVQSLQQQVEVRIPVTFWSHHAVVDENSNLLACQLLISSCQ
jgi:hypothetical protein